MKKFFVLLIAFVLTGCASINPVENWNNLSPEGKRTLILSGSILLAASIIKNSQGDTVVNVDNCVSTQSIRTGCRTPIPVP